VRLDCRGDSLSNAAAMATEGRGVELLFHRPEALQSRKRQLRARHLLDAPAVCAELLDQRRINASSARASVDPRVLVEEAVSDESDAGHG
jgi:hypothetical protein